MFLDELLGAEVKADSTTETACSIVELSEADTAGGPGARLI